MSSWWHWVWYWHTSFTKDDLDLTINLCVPRIWWRPWCIDVDRINVSIWIDNDASIPIWTQMNWEQFQEILAMDNRYDICQYIREEEKR